MQNNHNDTEDSDKLKGDEVVISAQNEEDLVIKSNPKQLNQNQKIEELELGPVLKTTLKIAIPSMIGMFSIAIYNTFNAVFIGQFLGDIQLTAYSNFVSSEYFLFSQPMISYAMGTSSLMSNALGKHNPLRAAQVQAQFFLISIFHSLFVPIALIFWLETYLRLLGVTPTVMPYCLIYGRILTIFGPFVYAMSVGSQQLYRVINNTTVTMWRQIIGAALNLLLAIFFMLVLKLGILSNALATVIQNLLTGCTVVFWLFTKKAPIQMKKLMFIPNKEVLWSILKLSIPTFASYVPNSMVQILSPVILKAFSQSETQAKQLQMISGIVARVINMCNMPSSGFIFGVQPILGHNIGAKNYKRVYEILKQCFTLVLVVMLIVLLLVLIFALQLVKLFTKSTELYDKAAFLLRLSCSGVTMSAFLQFVCVVMQQEKRALAATSLQMIRVVTSLFFQILLPAVTKNPEYMFYSTMMGDFVGGFASVYFCVQIILKYKKLSRTNT